ncbi:hypothetical protein T265_11622 [Opisthorchis viverrini]|uniref:Uncharacterized protein n=1 Tax=Opisthorchis viverrini TaxID=6198 RepID=A0A074Z8X4_OPIVI|nr:hypothetical protein T265_11622 [Opisthorchis viverrini]KER19665.1 hypothetical protein T265_11622 [Opisthorchis viverrini]
MAPQDFEDVIHEDKDNKVDDPWQTPPTAINAVETVLLSLKYEQTSMLPAIPLTHASYLTTFYNQTNDESIEHANTDNRATSLHDKHNNTEIGGFCWPVIMSVEQVLIGLPNDCMKATVMRVCSDNTLKDKLERFEDTVGQNSYPIYLVPKNMMIIQACYRLGDRFAEVISYVSKNISESSDMIKVHHSNTNQTAILLKLNRPCVPVDLAEHERICQPWYQVVPRDIHSLMRLQRGTRHFFEQFEQVLSVVEDPFPLGGEGNAQICYSVCRTQRSD